MQFTNKAMEKQVSWNDYTSFYITELQLLSCYFTET